jgi:hypothetical protein
MTNPAAPTPTTPINWRELRALPPLLIVLALVLAWTKMQFGVLVSAISTSVGVLAAWKLVKSLPAAIRESAQTDFLKAMPSRRLAKLLWIASSVLGVGSLLIGSARVNAEKLTRSVIVYRVQLESERAGEGSLGKQRVLEAPSSEKSFYVGLPFGKRVYLATSNNEMSRPMTVYPWIVPSVTYPGDFSSLPEVAILPAPRIRLEFGGDRWLRLVITREGTHPRTLAEDTLRAFQSRIVVFDTSTLSNDAAKALWVPLAKDSFSLDAADAELVVGDWLHNRQLLRSVDPLLPGQRVRVTLLDQKGDTISTASVTLTPGLSNVVLRK